MITIDNLLRVIRFNRAYGSNGSHYFDGRHERWPKQTLPRQDTTPDDENHKGLFVRKWDEQSGSYVYVLNDGTEHPKE